MSGYSTRKEWFVIVNPNAGGGKGKKDWKRISDLLTRENISFISRFTGRRGQAIDYTDEAIEKGFRRFISVGGDGTLNEVVNGIFIRNRVPANEITIAMIPVGTGNDWGRMFGIPSIYEGAVKVIAEGKTMLHDIGLVDYFEGEQSRRRYFINITGLGFEALVVKKTNRQKDRGRNSKAIYFFNILSSLVSYRITAADIIIDGRKSSADIFSINVGNGRYCGGGMRQTPDALPDDGLLDVTVIKEMGRLEIIKNLRLLYDGTILSHPEVDGYRCRNLKIESESLLFIESDGELLGHTPAEIGIIPSAVNIVYAGRLFP
ncbi:MAG TPA: diacylglycerol kinase family lipid kinase [Bacteroidales bacterium]|jgi:YegS/Rv2252/BmrU family lipid kinase|nr:diacylglycerol kinase family lipid kinase [Bacteroidales bacterium]HQH22939.1 diacylglycerol kinase family lipid kinase [Bacteroidales bacterium]HQJ82000.1 diacylglycerol kinase family lipid kinase [Bacteroidales bacterium]